MDTFFFANFCTNSYNIDTNYTNSYTVWFLYQFIQLLGVDNKNEFEQSHFSDGVLNQKIVEKSRQKRSHDILLFICRYPYINYYCMVQAGRGCAAGAFFFLGGGHLGKKGCNAPRAMDFREERNPLQADSIVSVF